MDGRKTKQTPSLESGMKKGGARGPYGDPGVRCAAAVASRPLARIVRPRYVGSCRTPCRGARGTR